MRTNTSLRTVDNNSTSSTAFTIQASGKMFHMVISGLYSNKPQSITREIWSNAFDAHVMVGKQDVPFSVTFPTSITPTFCVRDFGPGIAHEDMEGFYTVLGHSTKENTNTAVGKWGVGRMSPMSYTDTFSVVSRHKGMIAYYTVQLGPDGSPQLHVLAPPMPTNEESGLEVSFPVKRDDIHKFQEAAQIVSYGFSVPPTVTNSKDKQFEPVKKVFEGDGYYLYNDNRLGGAYAQMGCVIYPIPREMLDRHISAIIQFDIGDLEVTASREALSFGPNDPTAANIKKRVDEMTANMHKKMQEQVDAQPTLFKAAKLGFKLREHLTHKEPPFTYKGKDLTRYWDLRTYDITGMYAGYKASGTKSVGWGDDRTLKVTDDYVIFIEDTSDKKANVRAATRIATSLQQWSYYLWVRTDLSDMKQKAEVDRLLKDLDYPTHYVKDLPDDGPRSTNRAKVTVSTLDKYGNADRFDMSDATFQLGGYYYPMSNNQTPRYLANLLEFIRHTLNTDFILVPKTLWKKFEGNPKWVLLEPKIDEMLKKHEKSARAVYGMTYNEYPFYRLRQYNKLKGVIGDFARKTDLPVPDTFIGLERGGWRDHLKRLGLPEINNNQTMAEYKAILDKYPLLKLESIAKEHYQSFVDYFNLIDNASKE